MKIQLKVGYLDNPENNWFEEYDVTCEDAKKYAEGLIEVFNYTLRPGEKARKLLEVTVIDYESIEKHDWRKTNLITIMNGPICYDKQKCTRCGITGKRYGLSGDVIQDSKYKAKVYIRCDTSKKHIERKKS